MLYISNLYKGHAAIERTDSNIHTKNIVGKRMGNLSGNHLSSKQQNKYLSIASEILNNAGYATKLLKSIACT
ncbi:hypothetical protein GKR41_00780 [Candidatus Vallotia lariciata]|nr:hypothetical protein GKR41_00780 [Candidatus Vallotia lariciata]